MRYLCWVLLLLTGVGAVAAQTDTPPPPTTAPEDPPQYFRFQDARPIFPSGIIFQVEARVPDELDITLITLLVEPAGEATRQFVIPLDDGDVYTRQGDLLRVTYPWQFQSVDELPGLFTDVRYAWTLTVGDGTTETLDGTLVFTDQRYDWQQDSADDIPLTLIYPAESGGLARALDDLIPAYQLLADNATPLDPISIVIYPEDAVLGCTPVDGAELEDTPTPAPAVAPATEEVSEQTGEFIAFSSFFGIRVPCDPVLAAALYEQTPQVIFTERGGYQTTLAQLSDFLVARAYAPIWDTSDVPLWFQAGVTRVYDPRNTIDRLATIELAARSDGLLSFEQLQAAPPALDAPGYALWEAQSYGLVLYIASQYGLDAVYTLANPTQGAAPEATPEPGITGSFTDAYESVTGLPLAALYPAWETWVLTDDAVQAFALDVYGPPTRTPTPVLSPTSTNTRLPTRTPTDTPTVTWTPSVTPTPSITPSFTPRPARDVFTPTPTPTPLPAILEIGQQATQLSTPQLVSLGLIAVAAVIILIAVMVSLVRR